MVTVNRQVDPNFNDMAPEEFVAKTIEEPLSYEVPMHVEERGDAELASIVASAGEQAETLSDEMDQLDDAPQVNVSPQAERSEPTNQSEPAKDHDGVLDYVAQKQSTKLRQKARRRPKKQAAAVQTTTDLYSVAQVMEAINKYQLESVVVLPVFQNRSCADFALQLARSISAAGNGVAFVDTGDTGYAGDAALAGISDVINSDIALEDAVFADPMSQVDLMTAGTSELFIDDWEEGDVQEVVQELSESYDVTVLHDPMGTSVPYFNELVDHADMIIFATNAPLTRKQVGAILRENIDKVPAHSMFVGFESADGIAAA